MKENAIFELNLIHLYEFYVLPRLSWNTKRRLEINDTMCKRYTLAGWKISSISLAWPWKCGSNHHRIVRLMSCLERFSIQGLELLNEAIQNLSFYPCIYVLQLKILNNLPVFFSSYWTTSDVSLLEVRYATRTKTLQCRRSWRHGVTGPLSTDAKTSN